MFLISLAISTVFVVCMTAAVVTDIFTMKIPNLIVLALIAGFIILAPLAGMSIATMGWHLLTAALVLGIGFGLFALGGFGAGDIKFATATSLWLGGALTIDFLIIAGLLGGVAAVILLFGRRFALPVRLVGVEWIDRLHSKDSGIPYGIAMGPAALMVFPESAWMAYVLSATPIG